MLKKLLIATAISAAIAACSSTKEPEPAPESAPVIASAPVASEPVASAPVISNHNSVYFGFNLYDIKDGYTGIIKANADNLASNPTAKVQIQGNTDDIGSVEYNLALGQRRADAVKKALVADGAGAKQVEAVSYGKLKPKYPNDNDASRAQNRRSDIVYKSGQPNGYSEDSSGLPMVDGSVYSGTVVEGVQP
ncbi:MAG: OmpA family protein [Gammaproteobacteria bacterium]|nr:OmpA family protein [Gammaproteobacteria bacterium]